jgi:phage gp46-like protein
MEFGIKQLICTKQYEILSQLMQNPEILQETLAIMLNNISLPRLADILNISHKGDTYFSYGKFDFPLSGVVEHNSLRMIHNPTVPVKILSKNLTLDFSRENQSVVTINSDYFPNVKRVYLLSGIPNVIIDKEVEFVYCGSIDYKGKVIMNHKPQEFLVGDWAILNTNFMSDEALVQSVTQLEVSFSSYGNTFFWGDDGHLTSLSRFKNVNHVHINMSNIKKDVLQTLLDSIKRLNRNLRTITIILPESECVKNLIWEVFIDSTLQFNYYNSYDEWESALGVSIFR